MIEGQITFRANGHETVYKAGDSFIEQGGHSGLRRAFDSLVASGDQLCVEARFKLIGIRVADGV